MDALPTYRGMLTIVKEDKPWVPEIDQSQPRAKKGPNTLTPFPDRGSDEAFQRSCMPHTPCRISFF